MSSAAKALASIKAQGLEKQFIRTTEALNKDALLENPTDAQNVEGISIGSAGEVFAIKPYADAKGMHKEIVQEVK